MDQPVAGLLKDLKRRGLLDETLVVWGGEFGRTPMSEKGDGRDHNPYGFTMWMAGGGVKPGIVIGATDELGLHAIEDRLHVHDLHATILHCLGVDHTKLIYRHQGRPERPDRQRGPGLPRPVPGLIGGSHSRVARARRPRITPAQRVGTMRRYSFSIRGLMAFIVILGVALLALRTPSRIWANACFSLALGGVTLAIPAAVASDAERRAFWVGFATCGGVYFLFALSPWVRREGEPPARDHDDPGPRRSSSHR